MSIRPRINLDSIQFFTTLMFCILTLLSACDEETAQVEGDPSTPSNEGGTPTPPEGGMSEGDVCAIGYIEEGDDCVIDVSLDRDLDGVPDAVDNCIDVSNPPQNDCDLDDIGDLCDDERECGAQLQGYVRYFEPGEVDSSPLSFTPIEVEGLPSLAYGDEFGQYGLRHLAPNQHTLLVYPSTPDYISGVRSVYDQTPLGRFFVDIPVNISREALIQDLLIKPTGNLRGRVIVEDLPSYTPEHDLIGIYIVELPNLKSLTDPYGVFFLEGIPEGEYTIRAVREGYQPLTVVGEVIGLTTQTLNSVDEPIKLNPVDEPSDPSWTHDIEVVIEQPSDEINTVNILLEPLFPHQTDEQLLSLSTASSEGTTLVFTSDALTHRPHDVFIVRSDDETIEGSRRFNISADDGERVQTLLRGRGYASNEYRVLDQDEDGISDEEDLDIDGDQCPNEVDQAPNDPFICELRVTESEEVDSDTPLDPPYLFMNALYGRWSITQEDAPQSPASNPLKQVTHARYKTPLFHAYGEAALSLLRPQVYSFEFDEGATEPVALTLNVNTTFPLEGHRLIATHEPCAPVGYFGDQLIPSEGTCGRVEAEIADCAPQVGGGGYSCTARLEIPPTPEPISYRVWVYRETTPEVGEPFPGCTQCVNQPGVVSLSIYGLMRRQLVNTLPDIETSEEEESFSCDNTSFTVRSSESYAPNQNCFPLDIANSNCRPEQLISPSSGTYMITQIDFDYLDPFLGPQLIMLNFEDQFTEVGDRLLKILSMTSQFRLFLMVTDGHTYHSMTADFEYDRVPNEYCWGF